MTKFAEFTTGSEKDIKINTCIIKTHIIPQDLERVFTLSNLDFVDLK